MRVAITGAGGNIGRGITRRLIAEGHAVTASDLQPIPDLPAGARFAPADVRTGEGLDAALESADLLLHLPAWHGIHVRDHTEREFWELNVDGTFHALQAAVAAGVRRVVWLSSQAWHEPRAQYGFTKVVGELLLDYHRAQHRISYVAVRPGDLTPWSDWVAQYGRGLLYGRVDREDVLDAVDLSVAWVAQHEGALVVDAVHPDAVPQEVIDRWADDPLAAVERAFPGSHAVVERFGLDVAEPPRRPPTGGWNELGYRPFHSFGTWAAEISGVSDAEARSRTSDY